MAIRYKAVNASAVTENTDLTIASGEKNLQLNVNRLIYTVPSGCTAKVNYLRGSNVSINGKYRRQVSAINTDIYIQNIDGSFSMQVDMRTNGKYLHRVLTAESKNYTKDVSGTYLYLNEGDQLYMTCDQIINFDTNHSQYSFNFTECSITDNGYIYLSIIEEYQS